MDKEHESLLEECMRDLVDEVSCGLCFEVHRACKMGTFFLDESDFESQKQFDIVDEQGLDVFGQPPTKKQYECICPNCQRNMAASRFAPHLEKCMGMGRNSSRIASRRIATNSRGGRGGSDADSDDEDNDNDSSYLPERRAKKLRREKANVGGAGAACLSKKNRLLSKTRNADSPGTSSDLSSSQTSTYEALSLEEKKNLMVYTCGVISEHTKKMCTRSTRCPQHTDGQRRHVRTFLLSSHEQCESVVDGSVDDMVLVVEGGASAVCSTLDHISEEQDSSQQSLVKDSCSSSPSSLLHASLLV